MSSSNPPPPKWKAFLTSEHVEVTLRVTLSMLVCYSVSFWQAPILNANTRLLTAIVGPFVALLMPTLMFAYGGIILPMATLFLLAYAMVTTLLVAAVGGGDGAFCGLLTVFIFWVSFLRWEKATGPGTSILIIAVIFVSVLAFPNYRTVQNGFQVVVPIQEGPDGIDSVASTYLPRNTIPKMLSMQFSELLSELYSQNAAEVGDALEIESEGSLRGLTVTLEESGTIGDDSYAIFGVPGGLWLIRVMWSATGIENPLAAFYNLFVFWGWLFFSLAFIYFVPPFRTLRFALSKGMIPSALKDASTLIELHSSSLTDPSRSDEDKASATTQKRQILGGLVRHTNILFGGNLAKLTAFEARLSALGSSQPVCTWLRLKGVSDAVLKCVLVAVGIEEMIQESDPQELIQLTTIHVETTETLKSCGLALQTGKASFIKEQSLEETRVDPFRMKVHTKAVVESTKSYLLAMEGKSSESDTDGFFSKKSWMEIKYSLLPFYVVFTAYPLGLANVVKMFFQKNYWKSLNTAPYIEFYKFVWCIKYTAGFVVLLLMAVYWDDYNNNFSISTTLPKERFGPILATLNGGWSIIAYCFATTQSMEGSVKKGILRALGTVTGGFAGWLALLACEDSRYDSGLNPFGLVAWLTITTGAATYSATNRGFFARLGLSGDYSFWPIYFVITEVIVVMYCFLFFGPSGRNDVAVNRIVSNLVGIVIAVVFAFVPPGVWGGDPSHCREIVDIIEASSSEYLDILLKSREVTETTKLEEIANSLMQKKDADLAAGIRLHGLAKDVFDDANRLLVAPFLKTDAGLALELALVSRDVYVSSYLAVIAARIVSNPNFRKVALENDGTRSLIESYRDMFQNQNSRHTETIPSDPSTLLSDLEGADGDEAKEANLLLELFLRICKMVQQRVGAHHRALDKIKWGYTFTSAVEQKEEETTP